VPAVLVWRKVTVPVPSAAVFAAVMLVVL
jgi:hypothetical protein